MTITRRSFLTVVCALALCGAASAQMGANLCPPSSATDTAKQTGLWQDASTWTDGTVPVAGERVLIPAGMTVTNNGTTVDVLWIHVAGVLTCCDHCDTQLNVHTLYVPMGGAVRLGMPGMPATGKVVVELIPGPFLDGDWQKLSLGVICHGEFTAAGLDKLGWCEVAADVAAGAATLTVTEFPVRWAVGDRLLIAGTDSWVGETKATYQSEFRTIAAINGRTVTLDAPLAYRHFRWKPDLPFHVANLTRNVVIRSRDATQRGHLMFMSASNDISFTEIVGLGRTDKKQPVTDPRIDAVSQMLVAGSDANPRGRYADHVHKAGPIGGISRRQGNVVDGSPGWGMVNHASNCQWDNCITIRCVGFGAGTEEGQERGYIRRHLSAMNINTLPVGANSGRTAIGDWGVNGEGIWLQGGLVEVDGVVCFDNSGGGVHLFNIPLNHYPNYTGAGIVPWIQFPIVHDRILLEPDIYPQTEALRSSARVPARRIGRVTAYNNGVGVRSWHGPVHDVPTQVRCQFSDLTLWGRGARLNLEYSSNTDVRNVRVVGDSGFRGPNVTTNDQYPLNVRFPNVTISGLNIEDYKNKAKTADLPIFDDSVGANPTHVIDGTYPIRDKNGAVIR